MHYDELNFTCPLFRPAVSPPTSTITISGQVRVSADPLHDFHSSSSSIWMEGDKTGTETGDRRIALSHY